MSTPCRVPNWLLEPSFYVDTEQVSTTAMLRIFVCVLYAHNGKTGCYPHEDTLAKIMQFNDVRQIKRYVAEAKAKKMIGVERQYPCRANHWRGGNVYTLRPVPARGYTILTCEGLKREDLPPGAKMAWALVAKHSSVNRDGVERPCLLTLEKLAAEASVSPRTFKYWEDIAFWAGLISIWEPRRARSFERTAIPWKGDEKVLADKLDKYNRHGRTSRRDTLARGMGDTSCTSIGDTSCTSKVQPMSPTTCSLCPPHGAASVPHNVQLVSPTYEEDPKVNVPQHEEDSRLKSISAAQADACASRVADAPLAVPAQSINNNGSAALNGNGHHDLRSRRRAGPISAEWAERQRERAGVKLGLADLHSIRAAFKVGKTAVGIPGQKWTACDSPASVQGAQRYYKRVLETITFLDKPCVTLEPEPMEVGA